MSRNNYFSADLNASDVASRDHAVSRGPADMNRLGELEDGVPPFADARVLV